MKLQAVAALCFLYYCNAGIFGGGFEEHSPEGYTGHESGYEEIHVSYILF